ncbi:MAG TPA: dienelactone hydrolase family protein [Caulobacteraceae bacterium]
MVKLTRPEGSDARDLHLSRRMVGGVFFAGYAAFALGANAEPIHTDEAGLVTGVVQLPAADRTIPAYLARPDARGRAPVVLVVSEVFGIHEYIRDLCRRLAKAGYVAIAPDFFARYGDPAPLTDYAEIRKIVGQATEAQVLGDIDAAMSWLKGQPFADVKKAAITGFCWGGAVVWQACALTKHFDAGVAWYGRLARPADDRDPAKHFPLELAGQLKAPVLGLYGGRDKGIPLSDVSAMTEALAKAGKSGSDIIVYTQSEHGFHADYRPSYDQVAARDGWRRMLAFIAENGVRPRSGVELRAPHLIGVG